MRYVMRQKLISWGDDFTIKDEAGRDVYFADGKAFSIGEKLVLKDMAGNELASVRQKLLTIGKTYEVWRGDELAATVRKQLFTLLRAKFEVDVPGPGDLEAQGDLLDHEYTFTRGGQVVARVSKRWFTFSDSYGVDIAEGEDDVLILAAAVVIDMAVHDQDDD